MKKLLTAIFGFVLVCFSANADKKIGLTAAISAFDTSGTETLKSSSNKTSTDVSETVIVPSIFFELANEISNQAILASIYELSNRTIFVKLSIEQSALIEVKKDFLTFSKSISL